MGAMTLQEYGNILKYIKDNHRFGDVIGKKYHKHIKYVDSCFDMRTLTIFSVTLRGLGSEKTFSTANNTKEGLLYDEVMKWLEYEKK